MKIIVCEDYHEMSCVAAQLAAESLRSAPQSLVSFPGGDTPLGMIQEFVRLVNSGRVDISRARYVSLDEWVGLDATQPGSCAHFNHTNLLGQLQKPFAEAFIIDGAAQDMQAELGSLDDFINTWGPLGVSALGIGMNGHIGFNEEGVAFDQDAHIIDLSPVTLRVMNKYFGDTVHPTQGISQGIRQIMSAKKVIMLANGDKKADILAEALDGPVTNRVPASVLQNHPNFYVVVDRAAVSKLSAHRLQGG